MKKTGIHFRNTWRLLNFISVASQQNDVREVVEGMTTAKFSPDAQWWLPIEKGGSNLDRIASRFGGSLKGIDDPISVMVEAKPGVSQARRWRNVALSDARFSLTLPSANVTSVNELVTVIPEALCHTLVNLGRPHNYIVECQEVTLAGSKVDPADRLLFWIRNQEGVVPERFLRRLMLLPGVIVCIRVSPDHRVLHRIGTLLSRQLSEYLHLKSGGGISIYGYSSPLELKIISDLIDATSMVTSFSNFSVYEHSGRNTNPIQIPRDLAVVRVRSREPETVGYLLDSQEFRWATCLFARISTPEDCIIIPGDGFYLVLGHKGMGCFLLPFGVRLRKTNAAGLYLEVGCTFRPPIPDGQFRDIFDLRPNHVVAATQNKVHVFDSNRLMPIYNIWRHHVHVPQTSLSDDTWNLFAEIDREFLSTFVPQSIFHQTQASDEASISELIERARTAHDFIQVAELLSRLGDKGLAGEFFEKAARLVE